MQDRERLSNLFSATLIKFFLFFVIEQRLLQFSDVFAMPYIMNGTVAESMDEKVSHLCIVNHVSLNLGIDRCLFVYTAIIIILSIFLNQDDADY
jgi:hypothetical protein